MGSSHLTLEQAAVLFEGDDGIGPATNLKEIVALCVDLADEGLTGAGNLSLAAARTVACLWLWADSLRIALDES